MNPQEDLKRLLEEAAERALDNIDNYGFSIPFCLAVSHSGERTWVVADDPAADDSPELDYEACVRSITHHAREFARQGKFRALALARNVNVTVSTDGGPMQTEAVKVLLDHEEGEGYTAYLTYHDEDGKAVPDEIVYEELPERFFGV